MNKLMCLVVVCLWLLVTDNADILRLFISSRCKAMPDGLRKGFVDHLGSNHFGYRALTRMWEACGDFQAVIAGRRWPL